MLKKKKEKLRNHSVPMVPDSVKGTGFYTPMDIPPVDSFPETKQLLYDTIIRVIAEDWGPRCKTKDTDDFDDLITVGDQDAGRCPTCLVYEKFDTFWKYMVNNEPRA